MANTKQEETEQRRSKMTDAMKKPAGKLRSIHVEPASNGYTVAVNREKPAKKDKDGDSDTPQGYEPPDPPDSAVFNSREDALAHIDKHLD